MRTTIATILAALTLAAGSGAIARKAGAAPPFERMTSEDGDVHDVRGAGCVWANRKDAGHPRDRSWLMSMSDDRAVVKRNGRYVMLKPAEGAADMGPFTFDSWRTEGMTIAVREHGRATREGTAYNQPATLVVIEAGRTVTYDGVLNCGT